MILIAVIVGAVYSVFLAPKTEQRQVVPAGIGITPTCVRPLHTHDSSGTIHVETSINHDYTLGDFFAVWGKTLDSNGISQSTPLPETGISTSNPLGCIPPSDSCLASGQCLYHSHPVLTIIFKTNAPSIVTMTVDGNPDSSLQSYVLPRTAGTGNPFNIVITYGPGVPVSL